MTEQLLFWIARSLYRTELAHSSDMKSAKQNVELYHSYRADEVKRILEAVERYHVPITGRAIVDFGCNDGAISAEYVQRGAARVVGVDIDEGAVRRARALHTDSNLTFVQSGVNTVPLEAQSVDTIVSYDVFEHVSQPVAILKELNRILVPGGKVLIGTWSWRHPFAPHMWAVMPVPWAHVVFSERTLLRASRRVYHSPWYVPNMHDYDDTGHRMPDKYFQESIPTDYLNKYLIADFERDFLAAGFAYETHVVPFGSRYARWTRVCADMPWLRDFLAGYVWFVLTKSPNQPPN